MDFSVDTLHKVKIAIHILQAALIFGAWCVEIALFTTDDTTIGKADGWYFALCFLSIPVLLYQSLTLHFARSRKWANAYAFAILDIVWCICWLSAFASVAAWNTAGKCGGTKGCSLSKAMVGIGFFLFFFFAITSTISVHGAIYYHREHILPGSTRPANHDPDAEAFSTAPHGGEYGPLGGNVDSDKDYHSESEAVHPTLRTQGSMYNMNVPTSVQPATYDGPDDVGAGYGHSAHGGSGVTAYGVQTSDFAAPTPIRPGERLQFPAGNYL